VDLDLVVGRTDQDQQIKIDRSRSTDQPINRLDQPITRSPDHQMQGIVT
jgi:hypothetical protein